MGSMLVSRFPHFLFHNPYSAFQRYSLFLLHDSLVHIYYSTTPYSQFAIPHLLFHTSTLALLFCVLCVVAFIKATWYWYNNECLTSMSAIAYTEHFCRVGASKFWTHAAIHNPSSPSSLAPSKTPIYTPNIKPFPQTPPQGGSGGAKPPQGW